MVCDRRKMKQVVLVSGASSRLGRGVVRELARRGMVVYGGVRGGSSTSTREKREIEKELEVEWRKLGIRKVKLNVLSDRDCVRAVKEIVRREGGINVLVNNAGYTLSGPTLEFNAEEVEKILMTNVVGAWRLTKEAVGVMRGKGGGKIINVTSLNGLVSLPNFGVYSASKQALEALGEALRYELAEEEIWVTNVAPGAILMEGGAKMRHRPAREKFKLLAWVLPMVKIETVARKIAEVAESKRPPLRVLIGRDVKLVYNLKRFLPGYLWERLMMGVWRGK